MQWLWSGGHNANECVLVSAVRIIVGVGKSLVDDVLKYNESVTNVSLIVFRTVWPLAMNIAMAHDAVLFADTV